MKDEKVSNIHPKFYIILVNFEILMDLAIKGGEENRSTT